MALICWLSGLFTCDNECDKILQTGLHESYICIVSYSWMLGVRARCPLELVLSEAMKTVFDAFPLPLKFGLGTWALHGMFIPAFMFTWSFPYACVLVWFIEPSDTWTRVCLRISFWNNLHKEHSVSEFGHILKF